MLDSTDEAQNCSRYSPHVVRSNINFEVSSRVSMVTTLAIVFIMSFISYSSVKNWYFIPDVLKFLKANNRTSSESQLTDFQSLPRTVGSDIIVYRMTTCWPMRKLLSEWRWAAFHSCKNKISSEWKARLLIDIGLDFITSRTSIVSQCRLSVAGTWKLSFATYFHIILLSFRRF